MHVVLMILKIIGAILGGLLGLLVLLVILLLFVPVRYGFHLTVKGEIRVESCVSWLFHLVHVSIRYEQKEYKYCLRIFGIPVKQNRDEKKEQTHSKEKSKANKRLKLKKRKKNSEESKIRTEAKTIPETKTRTNTKIKSNARIREDAEIKVNTGQAIEQRKSLGTKEQEPRKQMEDRNDVPSKRLEEKPKKKKTFHPIQKLKKLYQSIRMRLLNIPKLWKKFKQQVRKLLDKKNKIVALLKDEGTKNVLRKTRKTVFGLLGYISPRNIRGYIRFGTGEPCQTGQLLGGISIVRAYYNAKVAIYPVFEEKVLEADLKGHGRIRVIRFLRVGAKFYLDKEVKKFIADVKQLKEELDG